MSKKIRWLRLALADLDELMVYMARDNPEAAAKAAWKIWETTRTLSNHPAMGKPGRVPGTREMVVTGTSYIVPYRVVANEVQILRILHGSRKWPEKF
ncbi:MAG: type II toxin-antitoxin system RelE/ParE family toxin [Deltaproteobacteria bacterium]|nr:type II toxin-antitoxin system RelE/ParE family toxin [Deltaproteobacteria bacterium]